MSARDRRRIECEYLSDPWAGRLVRKSGKLRQAAAKGVSRGNDLRCQPVAREALYRTDDAIDITPELMVIIIVRRTKPISV